MTTPTHDLHDFLKQASEGIRMEYERITRRSKDDPGTAGDEGELNWKELLSNWLPAHFHIENKGRILFADGYASPQVDVVVLSPEYPKGLASRKLFLASNVLAAFECKLTLRPGDIRKVFDNAAAIQDHATRRHGSLYRELHSPLIYGLIAHSHAWKADFKTPAKILGTHLSKALADVSHPRQIPDVFCVADLGTWTALKMATSGQYGLADERYIWTEHTPKVTGGFMQHYHGFPQDLESFDALCETHELPSTNHLAAFVGDLLLRLAWSRSELREVASYFRAVKVPSAAVGSCSREWPLTICSNLVQQAAIEALKRNQPPRHLEELFHNPALQLRLSNLDWNELGPQFV